MIKDDLLNDILHILREYRTAKTEMKRARAQLLSIAIDEFNMDPLDAKDMNAETFFDGYLTALGFIKKDRM